MSEAVFQAPKRRPRVYEAYEAPFPVPLTAEDAALQQCLVYRADMVNQHVVVRDREHIQALYGKGFFGKGILSRARPDHSISQHWEKYGDHCLPVIPFSKYQKHLSWAREVLLAQGLEEEAVNQTLQRFSHPVELEHREVTGEVTGEENGHEEEGEEGSHSPERTAEDRGETSREAEQDSETPQAKRPRRQGDPEFDPLAHLHPLEPKQVDQKALAQVKCPRHDDWIVHCGCQPVLEDSVLKTDTRTKAGCPLPDPGYEYVLVEEEKEGEGEEGEMGRPRTRLCLINPFSLLEFLQLSLEEAFFLVYALGCLSVYYNEEPLSVTQLWGMFRSVQPHFETSYAAYHYFRSKGWVPKPGLKYGTDLVLYRKGPPFYHASYSVVVERVDTSFRGAAMRPFTWRSLSALNRITGNVSKELMLCYVIYPTDLTEEDLSSPKCLTRVKVQEILMSRWISSKERTETDEI